MSHGRRGKRSQTARALRVAARLACGGLLACGGDAAEPDAQRFTAVTFNVGTNPGLPHDAPPDDGYGSAQAELSDAWYGDGLAWKAAIEAARAFFARVDADLVAFQEIFFTEECPQIPQEARAGFVCEGWSPGDPVVARRVLGDAYQIACHSGKPDKCLAVHRRFGTFMGCAGELCLDGLVGAEVSGCGSGARVARGTIERSDGTSLVIVSVHGTSGFSADDQQCRLRQVEQVFVDAGDGAPATRGAANLVLGDLNTDPGRAATFDPSAARWNDFVRPMGPFRFISEVGPGAPGSYLGLADIDHVVSDVFAGSCGYPGVDAESEPVWEGVYFDHAPVVCTLAPR